MATTLEVLEAHRTYRFTAGWTGSPDPSNHRNIAFACVCGEKVADLAGQKPSANVKHREHVARVLDSRCSCDGCAHCPGREPGCTCDVDWDALTEARLDG